MQGIFGQSYKGYQVSGRFLYDPCGNKVILRGVNAEVMYADRDGFPAYQEIARTGANCARVAWSIAIPANESVTNLQNAIDVGLIPIWCQFDAGADWGQKLDDVVNWWISAPTMEVIRKFEDHLIINIANEPGSTVMPDYAAKYIGIITKMRNAGIRCPLMIDADYQGRNVQALNDYGQQIIDADPLHNVLLSWHAWDVNMDYATPLQTSVNRNLPLVVAEFAHKSMGCQCCIDYKLIMDKCTELEIGYLPWSWGLIENGLCAEHSMTQNGTFETLWGWALETAITYPSSIKNTSTKSVYMTQGYCNGAPAVSISSPANGSNISANVSTAINATADGAAVKVEYYINDQYIAIDNSAPFSYTWTPAEGNYSIFVKAFNSAGNYQKSKVFRIKAGTPLTNVAINKKVVTSGSSSAYPTVYARDGNEGTFWSYSTMNGPWWIYVDLGKTMNIEQVKIKWETAYSSTYKIQFSTTGIDNMTDVFSTSSGDGGWDDIPNINRQARYVRCAISVASTQWAPAMFEFQVFSRDAKTIDITPPPAPSNLKYTNLSAVGVDLNWTGVTDASLMGYNV